MNIIIPDNIDDGQLKLLPEGVVDATLEKIMLGKSKSNKPKATFKYVVTKDPEDYEGEPIIGEAVLETYSLQPQALFNLAGVYKEVTKEKLPQGDYTKEEFEQMLNDTLGGSDWKLYLEQQVPEGSTDDELRTVIVKKVLA